MNRPTVQLDHEHPHTDGFHHYHYGLDDMEREVHLYLTVEVLTREKMQELINDPSFEGITRVYHTDPGTGAWVYGPLVGSEPNGASPDTAMMAFVDHYVEVADAV